VPKKVPIKRLRDSTVNVPSGDNCFYYSFSIEMNPSSPSPSPPPPLMLEPICNVEELEDEVEEDPLSILS
jgi:hypothetical protein